jgi:ABC-2 type transport system permease protein
MNLIGSRTLLRKELHRFMSVPAQTLLQPLLNTALYFLIFGYALGERLDVGAGLPYVRFIVPGLVMQAIVSNTLLNSASSFFVSKIQGTLVDVLLAPLTTVEVLSAYVAAALVRGLMIAFVVWAVAAGFTGAAVAHPLWVLGYALLVGVAFSLTGLVLAILCNNYEQLNVLPSFVINPLTLLGGVFYSTDMLPAPWGTVARVNPMFYMVDGFRYGVLGHCEGDLRVGLALVLAFTGASAVVAWALIERGHKLRG